MITHIKTIVGISSILIITTLSFGDNNNKKVEQSSTDTVNVFDKLNASKPTSTPTFDLDMLSSGGGLMASPGTAKIKRAVCLQTVKSYPSLQMVYDKTVLHNTEMLLLDLERELIEIALTRDSIIPAIHVIVEISGRATPKLTLLHMSKKDSQAYKLIRSTFEKYPMTALDKSVERIQVRFIIKKTTLKKGGEPPVPLVTLDKVLQPSIRMPQQNIVVQEELKRILPPLVDLIEKMPKEKRALIGKRRIYVYLQPARDGTYASLDDGAMDDKAIQKVFKNAFQEFDVSLFKALGKSQFLFVIKTNCTP